MTAPLKLQAAHALFEASREALSAFRTANPKLVQMYEDHQQAYNNALEEVKALYREHHETVGETFNDFSVRYKTVIDAELLIALAGDTGRSVCTMKYSVDRKEYNKAVESGLISQDIVDEVESVDPPAVYGPKKL